MRGTSLPLPRMRALLNDVLRASARIPAIPVQRTMSLAQLLAARAACAEPPPWSALFVKGYALVAREMDELRRAYLSFPWPRLYQFSRSVASIAVERRFADEAVLFGILIGHTADISIADIGARIRAAQASDINDVTEFRRALWMASLPGPVRRLILWIGFNFGRFRSRFFGTFTVSAVGFEGAELLTVIGPAPIVTYGPIAPDGTVQVRIIFDHRVTDGAPIARALARLEATLNGAVADEVLAIAGRTRPI
jgi:hypothetical protein